MVIGYVSISSLASLVGIPIGIPCFAVALKICPVNAGIKLYKPIIKKKKKKHGIIVLLAKTLSNSIKV